MFVFQKYFIGCLCFKNTSKSFFYKTCVRVKNEIKQNLQMFEKTRGFARIYTIQGVSLKMCTFIKPNFEGYNSVLKKNKS